MDIFDASDYDFLVSKRTRRQIAFALIIGIAFVPSVKSWYIGQIERHAEHISRELQDRITPDLEGPPKSSPAESAALTPASLRRLSGAR